MNSQIVRTSAYSSGKEVLQFRGTFVLELDLCDYDGGKEQDASIRVLLHDESLSWMTREDDSVSIMFTPQTVTVSPNTGKWEK